MVAIDGEVVTLVEVVVGDRFRLVVIDGDTMADRVEVVVGTSAHLPSLDEALDDPDDRLFFTLLEGLYHTHPVRFDAVGTHESIRQITPEILHRSWESFYRPQNMILCCAGDLHAESVCETAERLFAGAPPMQAETFMPKEPETVAHRFLSRKMSVGKPLFAVGFKCPPVTGDALERTVLLGTLALEL